MPFARRKGKAYATGGGWNTFCSTPQAGRRAAKENGNAAPVSLTCGKESRFSESGSSLFDDPDGCKGPLKIATRPEPGGPDKRFFTSRTHWKGKGFLYRQAESGDSTSASRASGKGMAGGFFVPVRERTVQSNNARVTITCRVMPQRYGFRRLDGHFENKCVPFR